MKNFDKETARSYLLQSRYQELYAYCSKYSWDNDALAFLGLCYHNGYGVERDYDVAFQYDTRAAVGGSADGTCSLAYDYLYGHGTARDEKKTVLLLRKAIQLGSIDALRYMGVCYGSGIGVEKSNRKEAEYYQKAGDAGDTISMRYLSTCYEKGWGVEKNIRKCLELEQKAAGLGDTDAMYSLACRYEEGVGQNRQLAFEWCRKAAEAGNTGAMTQLAHKYEEGDGVEKDEEKAVWWSERAAARGFDSDRLFLASRYAYGIGIEKDEHKAAEWYDRASTSDDISTLLYLATKYETGKGIKKDEQKAFKLYEKAANAGDPLSMRLLATCYWRGTGVETDRAEAVVWFRKASESGDEFSGWFLNSDHYKWYLEHNADSSEKEIKVSESPDTKDETATERDSGIDLYKQEEYDAAFVRFQKAAQAGDAIAMRFLGMCYENGNGVKRDKRSAFEWYRKAAEANDITAFGFLGTCYENGIGTEKDDHAAFECYQKAAEAGDAKGICCVGLCYANGRGVEKNDYLAAKCFQKAAEKGDEVALRHLGICYANGTGIEKNELIAFMCFQEAVQRYDTVSYRYLGLCYANGTGTRKDRFKAAEYLRRGADLLDAVSMRYLGEDCMRHGFEDNAFSWFREAAVFDDAVSMRYLGLCYSYGIGTSTDRAEALHWFKEASDAGDIPAKRYLGLCLLTGKEPVRSDADDDMFGYFDLSEAEGPKRDAVRDIGFHGGTGEEDGNNPDGSGPDTGGGHPHGFDSFMADAAGYGSVEHIMGETSNEADLGSALFNSLHTIARNQESMSREMARIHANTESIPVIHEKVDQMYDKLNVLILTIETDVSKLRDDYELEKNVWNDEEKRVADFVKEASEKITSSLRMAHTSMTNGETLLHQEFGEYWSQMDRYTRVSLVSARVLFVNSGGAEFDGMDYSGIVISAASALENELGLRFFKGYQAYLTRKYGEPSEKWPESMIQKRGRKYERKGYFTIGQLPYIFGVAGYLSSDDRNKLNAYMKTILSTEKSDLGIRAMTDKIFGEESIIARCESVRVEFRNKAAHTQRVARQLAEKCCDTICDAITASERMDRIQGLLLDVVRLTSNYTSHNNT